MLENLQNYKATATVKYISNKNINQYEVIQYVKSSGHYRIEVTAPDNMAGNITISDTTQVAQIHTRLNLKHSLELTENKERSSIILTNFIHNFLNCNERRNFSDGYATTLEIDIPSTHPYIATATLEIDNTALTPIRLTTYDVNQEARIEVIYNTFEINIELPEQLFDIESIFS